MVRMSRIPFCACQGTQVGMHVIRDRDPQGAPDDQYAVALIDNLRHLFVGDVLEEVLADDPAHGLVWKGKAGQDVMGNGPLLRARYHIEG